MRALITGITGQDGSYLAELLLSKGYDVHGIIRRSSSLNTGRIDHIFDKLRLHYGDITETTDLERILRIARPDELYNLAAQSHVRVSFDSPIYTSDVAGIGAARVFEAVKNTDPDIKIYQASSSEQYGAVLETPQTEKTPFNPRSPYACAKVYAHNLARVYRDSYGMFIACGILFNHESPRRGETFVTRKITRAVGRIKAGTQKKLYLGNLDAKRDWGHARDYVDAMWRMLQAPQDEDFVIATGKTYTVREFLEMAFSHAGLRARDYVEVDPRYFRPAEVHLLQGDASKARELLGWTPTVTLPELVGEMVGHDVALAAGEAL